MRKVVQLREENVKEILEKEVNKKGLAADRKKKVQDLIKSLNENDNNIVLFAKLRK